MQDTHKATKHLLCKVTHIADTMLFCLIPSHSDSRTLSGRIPGDFTAASSSLGCGDLNTSDFTGVLASSMLGFGPLTATIRSTTATNIEK